MTPEDTHGENILTSLTSDKSAPLQSTTRPRNQGLTVQRKRAARPASVILSLGTVSLIKTRHRTRSNSQYS